MMLVGIDGVVCVYMCVYACVCACVLRVLGPGY